MKNGKSQAYTEYLRNLRFFISWSSSLMDPDRDDFEESAENTEYKSNAFNPKKKKELK